jgi:hypothetical protein
LAVDNAASNLELALGERVDPRALRGTWLGAAVDVMTELAQLIFGGIAVALGSERVQRGGNTLELLFRTVALAGRSERPSGDGPRQRTFDRSAGGIRGNG